MQIRWLPAWDEMCLQAATAISPRDLRQQVQDLIAQRAFVGDQPLPRDEGEFTARLANASERIGLAVQEVADLLPPLLQQYQRARLALEQATGDRLEYARRDITQQIQDLTQPAGFLTNTPWQWLRQYPRYFQAIAYRLDKLASAPHAPDQTVTQEIAALRSQYVRQRDENEQAGRDDDQLERYRWMIEEYRVSVFAQPLGTSLPVSPKRLAKQWSLVQRS